MPRKSWFKFVPEGAPEGGVYTSPHFGELVVGEVYEVPADKAHLCSGPEWDHAREPRNDESADGGKE